MREKNKIAVLAQNEAFFLPNLIAILAREGLVNYIFIYEPRFSYKKFKKTFHNLSRSFGLLGCFLLAISGLFCIAADFFYKYKFYSLKKVAKVYNIPITDISDLDTQKFYDFLATNNTDIIFAQVNEKIGPSLLNKAEIWNKHCSLLPSYRGVYPVFWSMLNQEPLLGVTIHKMTKDFDAGPILSQTFVPNKKLSFFGAYHKLYDYSAELLVDLCTKGVGAVLTTDFKDSYYSFPKVKDRKKFLKQNRFGFPFRLHPSVKPMMVNKK